MTTRKEWILIAFLFVLLVSVSILNLTRPAPVQGQSSVTTLDGRWVYVPDITRHSVFVYDNTSRLVTAIPVGRGPSVAALSADGKTLQVFNSGENTVSLIDVATNRVRMTLPAGH